MGTILLWSSSDTLQDQGRTCDRLTISFFQKLTAFVAFSVFKAGAIRVRQIELLIVEWHPSSCCVVAPPPLILQESELIRRQTRK